MKSFFKIYIVALVFLQVLVYFSFSFVILDLNAFNWAVEQRSFFVFVFFSILTLSIPIAGAIKTGSKIN